MSPEVGTVWRCIDESSDMFNKTCVVKEASLHSDLNGHGVVVLIYSDNSSFFTVEHRVGLRHEYLGRVETRNFWEVADLSFGTLATITEIDIISDSPFLVHISFVSTHDWYGYFKTFKGAKISLSKRLQHSVKLVRIDV
jgi:hypothetical protein